MSALQEKYLELMHAEMDGQASHEELVALREYLANHPEAQKMHTELAELTHILDQVEEIEAPADLRKNITAALPRRRSLFGIGLWNNRSRSRTPWIRYGYALAAGVLLGAVLSGIVLKNLSPAEESELYGTMTSLKNAQRYVVTERIKLPAPDLGGTVEVSRSGDNERIVFNMDSRRPIEVEVRFDGSRAALKGFIQQPNSVHSLEAKEGGISFRSEGKQSSAIILGGEKRAELPLNLRFYVDGKLAHETTVGAATGSHK